MFDGCILSGEAEEGADQAEEEVDVTAAIDDMDSQPADAAPEDMDVDSFGMKVPERDFVVGVGSEERRLTIEGDCGDRNSLL